MLTSNEVMRFWQHRLLFVRLEQTGAAGRPTLYKIKVNNKIGNNDVEFKAAVK